MRKYLKYFLLLLVSLGLFLTAACSLGRQGPAETKNLQATEVLQEETQKAETREETESLTESEEQPAIDIDGCYTSKEDVALYIHTYGKLPENFITKKEAQALGWSGGSLESYAPGMSIGGDRFGNFEGLLPEEDGVTYTECDIDTMGAKSRGAKRSVFSNTGKIYYTEDHYESFKEIIFPEG